VTMPEPRYLAVKNWDKFQHYKQRNPPWIRLHRTLLRDHKFNQLTENEQWMLVRMWLLASESDNHMAYDEKWVRRAINSSKKVPLEKFVSMGFLEVVGERLASTVLAERKQLAAPEAEENREERTSIATPVDNSREEQLTETLVYMDSIGFQGRPRLEALALGPSMMDEAIRRTRSRSDVDNPAAYFTTVTRNLLAVQRAWKSDMPLEERLETYVRNAGHEYMNHDLAQELQWKGADRPMIARLLVKADEIRQEAA
jgi:hypothetical protein